MRYRNTYQCDCGALVGIGTRWVTGLHGAGTDGTFRVTGSIPAGHCPICRRAMQYGLWF